MPHTPQEPQGLSTRTPGAAAAHRGVRRQKAFETRWRIMDAALAEFTERGYHDATMAAIAERAGVAVQTVYLGFRTKGGLLEDLVGNAVLGRTRDGQIGRPDETEAYRRALAERDGVKALELWVDAALPVYVRTSAISDVGRAAYVSDPYIADWWVRSEALRLDGCVRVVQSLAEHGWLRAGLSIEEGADILATTLSPQSFLAFTVDRGWTVDHLGQWLKHALPRLLLDTSHPPYRLALSHDPANPPAGLTAPPETDTGSTEKRPAPDGQRSAHTAGMVTVVPHTSESVQVARVVDPYE